ncbi:MAG: SPFH domain-containing protein [Actinomycetota bacterium]
MATITRRPIVSHLRSSSTTYVRRLRNGQVVNDGIGQSFWFVPRTSSISELPIDERELPLIFRDRTSDFQEISVQASITYRIARPSAAAERIDFTIDNTTGAWVRTPLEQIGGLLTELAQQHATAVLASLSLTEVLGQGVPALRGTLGAGLRADDRLIETGLEIVDVRVVAVRPETDMEQALQTPVREQLQQEADRAMFERRALAVEQERGISENELQNRIELAIREEQLVAQTGANEQRRVTDEAETVRIRVAAEADATEVRGRAQAATVRDLGAAKAEAERLRVAAYGDADDAVLLSLAVGDLAGGLPDIGTLVLSPDLVSSLAARFLGAAVSDSGLGGGADDEGRRALEPGDER